jgi:putative methionine-R-sulfoxide reductase with GAF domain
VNMASTREDDKPWKTDLARKSAARRDQVLQEVEDVIKKAPSFEEALRVGTELLKKRFARYSAVTVYVADGEELAVHTSVDRPSGPERIASTGNPLADATATEAPTVVSSLSADGAWAGMGLTHGSALVAPVRTEAGLWAIVEVWSEFREAFSPLDAKLLGRVAQALARKTPAA